MNISTIDSTMVLVTGANGHKGVGPVAVPGLKAGDILLSSSPGISDGFQPGIAFEQMVSVDDQLQQLSGMDWSNSTFTFWFIRPKVQAA